MNTDEFSHVLGLLLEMEMYAIHGPRHVCWADIESILVETCHRQDSVF